MTDELAIPTSVTEPLLYQGDCINLMRRLPPDSIDAVVDDPPAGIGFMGKAWDSFKAYEAPYRISQVRLDTLRLLGLDPWAAGFVAFMADCHVEAMRVMKPGAYMLVWALPKTADLAGLALRLAGFDICDSLLHLFGCLSDDAEALTEFGWLRGRNVAAASLALCYDHSDGLYRWQRIKRYVRFPHAGSAYEVRGEGTMHTVTPDHRCLDARDGFIPAEEAARESALHVPIPEGLRGLRVPVDGHGDVASTKEADVLEGVRERTDAQGSTETRAHIPANTLRDLRSTLLAQEPNAEPALLLAPLLRFVEEYGPVDPRTHAEGRRARSERVDGCQPGILPAQDERAKQPGMEGRCDGEQPGHAKEGRSACSLSCGVLEHGSPERLRARTQAIRGTGVRSPAHVNGVRASHESRPPGQPADQPRPLPQQQGSQTVRGARGTSACVARVERVDYDGMMWCVTVPSGAFVARANGMPFVTGNSGFPKSHDVSKALDKLHGVERDVLEVIPDRWAGKGVALERANEAERDTVDITAPATPDAQRWDGYGTALAPGHEHWLLARKPTQLTYARNVLEHGCGALHIEACRVATSESLNGGAYKDGPRESGAGHSLGTSIARGENGAFSQPSGRWPANVTLSTGGEGCPAEAIDAQAPAAGANPRKATSYTVQGRTTYGEGLGEGSLPAIPCEPKGGASRFFPRLPIDDLDFRARYQAKASDRRAGLRQDIENKHPTHKHPALMRWLQRLVTPTAKATGDLPGVVLSRFLGSGTDGVAAVAEGFRFIGSERDPEHFAVARSRIMAAIGSPEAAAEANEQAPKGAQLGLL